MKGTMSILGLLEIDNTLFDDMTIPTELDSALLVETIVFETAELEVLYPDPAFMKSMIALWSAKEMFTWQRFINAVNIQYNPLENYDRQETWTDSGDSDRSITTNTTGTSNATNRGNNLHYEYGFNDNAQVLQSSDQREDVGSTTVQSTDSGNETTSDSKEHTGRVHGNIGVTTSQQMLQAELDLAPLTNVYNYIADSFKKRFCLMIF